MFTFSLLQNYLKKQTNQPTCLTIQNLTPQWIVMLSVPILIWRGTQLPRSLLGPSLAYSDFGLAGTTAHMWVHKFEPSLTAFLMALDSGATATPQDGHHVACHNTLLPHPSPMLPWGGLKVLKGNLLLLCFVHFCVLCGASHRPGPNEALLCNNLVVQKQSGSPPIGGCSGASGSFLAGGWSH